MTVGREPIVTDHRPVDIVILSGFLGSGKTTLLSSFLRGRQLQDTAVIVNEVGEIGIDAAVLNENVEDDDILMLDNGCVCCSLRSSLVDTVLRLLRMPRPRGSPPLARIVVETSGLSKPGPIVASLRDRDLVYSNLRLMVVSTFDSTRMEDAAYYGGESHAQWAASHRIVITKLDCLANKENKTKVMAHVMSINPLAEAISTESVDKRVQQAFAPLDGLAPEFMPKAREQVMCEPDQELAHAGVLVLRGQAQAPLDWDDFANWVDDMAGLCGERLLRFKALVRVAGVDQPVLLQSVGTTFSSPVRMTRIKNLFTESVLILIVRQMDLVEFERHLPNAPITLSRFAVPSRRTRRVFDVPIVQ